MYVAVKGGERAIRNAHRLLADKRRGARNLPDITLDQIATQLALCVDRIMSEGSLYDRDLAALAMKQARGDLIEAIFLVRAYRTTAPRFGFSEPIDTARMKVERRVSATFKDLPGGQLLGPTFDYTHRLLDPTLEGAEIDAAARSDVTDEDRPMPRVTDLLAHEDLIEGDGVAEEGAEIGDLTREPLSFPAERDLRLQALARGDEGFLLGLGYSTQRGYSRTHPFVGEIRIGEVEVAMEFPELGFTVSIGEIQVTECQMVTPVQGLGQGPAAVHARLRPRLRPGRTQGHGHVAGRQGAQGPRVRRGCRGARPGRGIRALALRQRPVHRLRRAPEAAPLRRFPGRARSRAPHAPRIRGPHGARNQGGRGMNEISAIEPKDAAPVYNFAYLDEQTKRMIRRALLKAVAIPGYQVPFASREMPMPYGWGTGGVQVTAAVLGPDDTLKVIDQGADDTTNAVAIRGFFEKTAGVATTTVTEEATVIQTRHRIPETPLSANQILVYQVPIPEPLRYLEPREVETRKMHGLAEYGLMHVKLYEDIARHGHIATTYAYPVNVNGRYVMDPSPIPKFDNPKMDDCEALQLFGAGREKTHLRHPAAHLRRQPRLRGPSLQGAGILRALRAVRLARRLSRRGHPG